jgi:hypothetical protein
MSRVLRFITHRRFNFIDSVCVAVGGIYMAQGEYGAMAWVWFLGVLVSVVLEHIAAGTEGRS